MNNNDIQTITQISNNNQTGITNIENITPVNSIQNNIQPQVQTPTTNISSQDINDEFAKGFPDWDLIPPYTTVRRVTRK